MAYDEKLADRIREQLADLPAVEEKKMMGGLTFMVNDKMCVGVFRDMLMCRVDPELHESLIEKDGCRTMDFADRPTRRPMIGYLLIEQRVMKTKKDLDYWIGLSLDFNKRAKSSRKKKK
jgi:TfoX/Sxy family transcriptional regulator of competence genes